MKKLIYIAIFSLSGCALMQKGVDQEDVNAWKGAPLVDLETHPQYSAMPLEKRILSNGDVVYNFRNAGTGATNCYTGAYGHTSCSTDNAVCNHQFIVHENSVAEYRPTGNCYTDCDRRPASRPCK